MKRCFPVLFGIFFTVLAAGPADAQWRGGSPSPYAQAAMDENQAISQSISNTIIPVAVGWGTVWLFANRTIETAGASMAVYGLIAGPSTGSLNAGDYLRGGTGVIARAAGAWLLRDATAELFGRDFADALGVDDGPVNIRDTEILVGGGLFVTSIAFNLLTTRYSVREYNRRRGFTLGASRFRSPFTAPVPLLSAGFNF